MTDVKPVSVPLGGHFKLSETQTPTTKDEKTPEFIELEDAPVN